MRQKRIACAIFAGFLLFRLAAIPAGAVETADPTIDATMEAAIGSAVSPCATVSFSTSIPAKGKVVANSGFSLSAGEVVTIKGTYVPSSASVDYGLIAPDGKYYYFNVTSGSIDKSIQVSENGTYTFQVRNNSDSEVQATGFVLY